MRILFIHGIAQQDYSESELLAIWTDHLLDHGLDAEKLAAAKAEMAYYGGALAEWTAGTPHGAVPMGGAVADKEVSFLARALGEIAKANGFSEEQIETAASKAAIAEGATAIAQSSWLGRRAVAILSLLERVSPLRGRIAARVVRQAYTYLAVDGARDAINDLVRPRIGPGEVVIVAHSLGTVVAFNLLRELADAGQAVEVPLLITCGSPLGIEEVQRRLGGDFTVPACVRQWRNHYDKGDPVTLGRGLSGHFIAEGILDEIVDNNTPNGHSIAGYLDDEALIHALEAVL